MNKTTFVVLFALSTVFSACQGPSADGVAVTFREIKDDVAYIDIRNGTQEDITTLNVELSFLDGNGAIVKVDTLTYSMADGEPFLEAGSETFIVQSIEPGTVSVSVRRLE